MSASNATITPANIVLTPMRVTAYPPGGGSGVDLGGTEGGVTVSIKTGLADIMVDQFGKTPIDAVVSGHTFGVKFTLAESANKANWKQAFPHFTIVDGEDGAQLFLFNMQIGDHLLNHAGKLVLHPLSVVNSDYSQDITIDLAACNSASDLKYGPDKQVGIAVDFIVFPNTAVSPARFMTYGDPSIGVVAATAASPTAGSNTGNGTLTSQVPGADTVNETITVNCIAVDSTHGNIFAVTGSVSGRIGTAALAGTSTDTVNFVSTYLSFTLTQGSVEFAYGDSWTVVTTAANYA